MRRGNRFRDFMQDSMAGRYGFDPFSRFLSLIGCAAILLSLVTRKTGFLSSLFSTAALVLLVWCYARAFSRKNEQRAAENRKYLEKKQHVLNRFRLEKDRFSQRKEYVFFQCPGCRKTVRVPRGKGRIRITCRSCGYSFERKT